MHSRLAVLAALCVALYAPSALAQVTTPAPTPGVSAAADTSVTDTLREWFPKTRGWFRLVETLELARTPDGRLAPVFGTLTHPRIRVADGAGRTIIPWFAPRFAGRMRLESGPTHVMRIEVEPIGARDVPMHVERGVVVYPGAYRDTDVLYKATPTHTDEYLLLRTADAPHRWRFKIIRGRGAARLRQAGNSIEVVDADGAAMMRATPPVGVDRDGRRVTGTIRLGGGDVVIVDLPLDGLSLPVLVDPDWASTGDMRHGRFYHQANVLPDGKVLVTGGCESSVCSGDLSIPACRAAVQSAEALSLDTRTFSTVAESASPRFFHTAESLADGDVLVVGGCITGDCSAAVWLPEIYSATRHVFTAVVDADGAARAGMASTRLADGRILLAGGCTLAGCVPRTDVYDPVSGHIDTVAPMNVARGRAATIMLGDGRVLVAGGCTNIDCRAIVASAEIYNPSDNTWTATMPMSTARAGHFAASLGGGRAIVGGGCATQRCAAVLRSVEIFDASTMSFVGTSSLQQPRVGAVALTLPDGSVLVNQGCDAANRCDLTNELFDPRLTTFERVSPAITVRAFQATLLHRPAGMVIAIGGCQPSTCSWWNETWDVSSIVAVDGGIVGPIDGGGVDGGRPDAGPRPPFDPGAGCSCHVVANSMTRTPWMLLGLALGVVILRSRRRR